MKQLTRKWIIRVLGTIAIILGFGVLIAIGFTVLYFVYAALTWPD